MVGSPRTPGRGIPDAACVRAPGKRELGAGTSDVGETKFGAGTIRAGTIGGSTIGASKVSISNFATGKPRISEIRISQTANFVSAAARIFRQSRFAAGGHFGSTDRERTGGWARTRRR
jgi:hypothetical protein